MNRDDDVFRMKIKVATDISILGSRFDSVDPKHGIYNAIEEVLTELCKREDVETAPVGLCGWDPLSDSMKALLYLEQKNPSLAANFKHTFSVSLGLTKLYSTVFHTTLSAKLNHPPSHSARGTLTKATSALMRLTSCSYRLLPPKRVFAHENFDVFHCPHPDPPPPEITGNLPRVVTVYDLIPVMRPDFVTENVSNRFRNSLAQIDSHRDRVICISEFTRQEFLEYTGMSPARVTVASLAAARYCRPITDQQAIRASRSRFGIPSGRYFLSVAAPQPRKNLTHLIHAFFRLLNEHHLPEVYLVLAGSKAQGWMYDDVFAAAQSSDVHRSRIIFTGYVPDEELAALYSGATAFVFPSLYEGFGMPPLEAMICGTPVITSNRSSLPEVVADAGLMVEPDDADALCQAMLDVLSDERLRDDLSRKGLARARSFSWEKCASETVKALKLAADQGRA